MANEETTLSGGQVIIHHALAACEGRICSIHNPSDHEYKDYPQFWNISRRFMERKLPDGSYVLDPDEWKLISGVKIIYRNSALCFTCNEEIASESRWDFVTCSCGNLSVDGGYNYRRRAFSNDALWVDTSIVYNNDKEV